MKLFNYRIIKLCRQELQILIERLNKREDILSRYDKSTIDKIKTLCNSLIDNNEFDEFRFIQLRIYKRLIFEPLGTNKSEVIKRGIHFGMDGNDFKDLISYKIIGWDFDDIDTLKPTKYRLENEVRFINDGYHYNDGYSYQIYPFKVGGEELSKGLVLNVPNYFSGQIKDSEGHIRALSKMLRKNNNSIDQSITEYSTTGEESIQITTYEVLGCLTEEYNGIRDLYYEWNDEKWEFIFKDKKLINIKSYRLGEIMWRL